MNVRTRTAVAKSDQPAGGFLYGWLLLALFIEYARPTNQLTWLEFPYFYSLVPMGLLLATMGAKGLRPAKDIFADRMTKWVLIFIGLIFISYAITGFNGTALNIIERVLGYVFLYFMITRLCTTEQRLLGVVLALMVAHLYLLSMNFQVLTNPSQRQYIIGGTFLGDGNDFGLSVVLLFPGLLAVGLQARGRFMRWLGFFGAGVIPIAIVATQSRGATLGLAAVFMILWWRSTKKMLSLVALGIVGIGMLAYAPPEYFARMDTLGDATADSSAQGRLDAWSASIGMSIKGPLGIGAGAFSARWGRTAHSTYFLALGELGVPGFLVVLTLVFGNIRENMKLRQRLIKYPDATTDPDKIRVLQLLDMMNAGMVGFSVAGAFLSATYYPHIYVLTAMLMVAREFASRRFPPPPEKVTSGLRRVPRPGAAAAPAPAITA